MKQWNLRSPEVANLLNPAFCGHVLYVAIAAYSGDAKKPMPYVLSFVILPLVLHQATSLTIEGRTSQLQLWLAEHPEVKVQVGSKRFPAVAHSTSADEKRRLWKLMTDVFPWYAEYQAKTKREIPVVVLERAGARARSGRI